MRCSPLFSPEDSDLAALCWRTDRGGYPRSTDNKDWRHPKSIFAHRLVLERKLGRVLTSKDIADHINGNRQDNRRENLRITDLEGNAQNKPALSFRGTTLHKCGKWQASVGYLGKSYYCGLFAKREDAEKASAAKRVQLGFLGATDTPSPKLKTSAVLRAQDMAESREREANTTVGEVIPLGL